MQTKKNEIDWLKTINTSNFISCNESSWNSCRSYCCDSNFADFNFKFMTKNGINIFYLEQEFENVSENEYLRNICSSKQNIQEYILDFGGEKTLKLVSVRCTARGNCTGIFPKPLLCKLYPYIPVFSTDSKLETLIPGSLFDLTFEIMGWNLPCTIAQDKKYYIDKWENSNELISLMTKPYILFHLRAAYAFSEIYATKLASNKKLNGLNGEEFWRKWEIEFLMGNLMDIAALKERLSIEYQNIEKKFGKFI